MLSSAHSQGVLDGSTDDEEERPMFGNIRVIDFFRKRLLRIRRQGALDGSADEPTASYQTPVASEDTAKSSRKISISSLPSVDVSFAPVDWNPHISCPRTRSSESLGPLNDPRLSRGSLPLNDDNNWAPADHRARFELARRAEPSPENATTFLKTQESVYDDLGSPEYVDKLVTSWATVRRSY
jgi:hypothetical protein